jgi:type IV pilus assembly protein PilA
VLNNLRKRLQGEEGFTLIELLVVILIIGILAAIAIPSFLNQKGKGEDTAAKSAARSAQTAMETYYTDNNTYACGTAVAGGGCDTALHAIEGTLPTFTAATGAVSMSVSDSNGATGANAAAAPSATQYRVTVVSAPSGRTFSIDKSGNSVNRVCYVPTGQNNGGCKNVVSNYGTW